MPLFFFFFFFFFAEKVSEPLTVQKLLSYLSKNISVLSYKVVKHLRSANDALTNWAQIAYGG